ncbi:insulinase family protein [Microbacterium sp. LjRoot45]|uniref:M16 family metallopeptidase n=1 Tax=Microbacterium sp. LjRoot45 TaxID=3342329 RepID=UPI003ECDBEDD
MPIPPITAVDVDGIPAYWADIRTNYTGTFTFGVGLRDETARTAGLAHLIEHLVMARVGRVNVTHNATTADESISFYAQGSPAAVGDFLTRVGQAISSLHETTPETVAEQRRIISNELGDQDERPGRGHLIDRFGNRSVGLLDLGSPAHRSHTREDVLRFADEWLHVGNAALSFTGPPPEGLSITLPPARALPSRPDAEIIRHGQWVVNGDAPLVLSVVVPADDLAVAGIASALVADTLLGVLRTERHLIYSVGAMQVPLTRDSGLTGFVLDPRPEHVVETAAAALDVLRRLAAEGPTAEALAEQIEKWQQSDEDAVVQAEVVDGRAIAVVRGRRSRDDETPPATPDHVTAEAVRDLLAGALETVFVTMGEELEAESEEQITEALGLPAAEDPDPLFPSLTKWQLMSHYTQDSTEIFGGKLFSGARGADLVIDTERVSLVDDGVSEVRYDDIVLATYSEKLRLWTLIATQGHIMFVDLDQWRRGSNLHALLGRRIPGWAQCEVDAA